jgi:hypothetical protein
MLSRPLLPMLATLALVPWGGPLLAEEEIRLSSGEVVMGELVKETDTTVEVKRLVLIKHVPTATTVSLPKNLITRRQKVPPLTEQYQARIKNAADSLESQCAIARWCIEKCLMVEALEHTRKADAEDAGNPIVAKLFTDLGYVKDGDAWVKEEDYLAKTGKVALNGKIMTPEEAEKSKGLARAAMERDTVAQQIKDAEWTISNSEGKLKEATERLAKAKEAQGQAKGDSSGAKARQDALNKRIANRANGNGNGGNGNGNRNNQTQAAAEADQKALQEATATLSKATQELKEADRAVTEAEHRLAAIKQALEKAKADLPALKDRKVKADEDLAKLQGKAPPAENGAEAKPDGKGVQEAKPKSDDKAPAAPAEGKPRVRFGGN